jgi:hypothetical protein
LQENYGSLFLLDTAYFLLLSAEKCGLIGRLKCKQHWLCYSKTIPRNNCLKTTVGTQDNVSTEQQLWLAALLNLLKPSGFCYVPSGLTVKGSTFYLHSAFM